MKYDAEYSSFLKHESRSRDIYVAQKPATSFLKYDAEYSSFLKHESRSRDIHVAQKPTISILKRGTEYSDDHLVWLKRENSNEPRKNIGGTLTDGVLYSRPFTSFSEFTVGTDNPDPGEGVVLRNICKNNVFGDKSLVVIPVILYITLKGGRMKTVTFKLEEARLDEVDALCDETGESRSSLIKKALDFYMDNYDGIIAKSRYERADAEWVVHEDLLKEYGLI